MKKTLPFEQLKERIESKFSKDLKMEIYRDTISVPNGNNSTETIAHYFIKLDGKIIWDFPNHFKISEQHLTSFDRTDEINGLIQDYLVTPKKDLPGKIFKAENDGAIIQYLGERYQDSYSFRFGLTDIFKAADRRLLKRDLLKLSVMANSTLVNFIIWRRYNVNLLSPLVYAIICGDMGGSNVEGIYDSYELALADLEKMIEKINIVIHKSNRERETPFEKVSDPDFSDRVLARYSNSYRFMEIRWMKLNLNYEDVWNLGYKLRRTLKKKD